MVLNIFQPRDTLIETWAKFHFEMYFLNRIQKFENSAALLKCFRETEMLDQSPNEKFKGLNIPVEASEKTSK